jgi:hypothetical protein
MTSKSKFNLIYGLLWGVFTALGVTGWETWIDHWQFSLTHLIVRLTVFSLVGIGWSSAMWRFRRMGER